MDIQIISIIAIITGPIFAVIITLWYQKRNEKRNSKMQLFMSLMAHRKEFPVNQEWVNALNLIDVIFVSNKQVVTLWHDYHDLLYRLDRDFEGENRKYLDLLLAIAHDLGYKDILQTDIDRFYTPIGLGDKKKMGEDIQKEYLQFLKNANAIYSAQNQN